MLATMSPPVQVLSPASSPLPRAFSWNVRQPLPRFGIDSFHRKVKKKLQGPIAVDQLSQISATLQHDFEHACRSSDICFLPSFCHTLPTGDEQGTFLALDIGGSTLRVALIELSGRQPGSDVASIVLRKDYEIDDRVRSLQGREFFSWIAERIDDTFVVQRHWLCGEEPLRLGLAWSFPVEQRSIRDGGLLQMGKGFRATEGLLGHNIADLIQDACVAQNMNIHVAAIVNDSSSSLLSGAYLTTSSTSSPIALILGTGLNATIQLPVTALDPSKFGSRPKSWYDVARQVLVNTELSLFGHSAFPKTKWDDRLNRTHSNPDFQPLEMLTSGRYLGEIVRLILVDAVNEAGLFGGVMPSNFASYALTAQTVGQIEADTSPSLATSIALLEDEHPLPGGQRYRLTDVAYVRNIAELVSTRATAWLAASIHALLEFKVRAESKPVCVDHITIACDGSVLEKYPRFRERLQLQLDELIDYSRMSAFEGRVTLAMTTESPLIGAAVAIACQHIS